MFAKVTPLSMKPPEKSEPLSKPLGPRMRLSRSALAASAVPDPNAKQMSEESYKELLWHMLLRGTDTFFMWCPKEEDAKEVQLVYDVYAAAQQLFSAHEDFQAEIGTLRGQLLGSLHIGVMDNTVTNPNARIHQAIARFMRRDHAVHITLNTSEPATLERGLLDGKLHIGISAFYQHVPGLNYERLFNERQTLYCGASHPLYPRAPARVSLSAVAGAKYVARGYMGHRAAKPTVPMNTAATSYDMESIARFILSGHFIGYLPAHYAALWFDRGQMRPLLPDRLDYDSVFEVATRKGAPKIGIVEAFLEDLRRETRGISLAAPKAGAGNAAAAATAN